MDIMNILSVINLCAMACAIYLHHIIIKHSSYMRPYETDKISNLANLTF